MTATEKEDLARYVMRNATGTGTGTEPGVSGRRLARLASRVCGEIATDPDRFLAELGVNDRASAVAVLAVVLAYCPEHGRALEALITTSA